MKLCLDLFCGAGGCSVGYHRAGYEIVGVDTILHPDYPFRIIQADALSVLKNFGFLDQFDLIHASPPCYRYSTITLDKEKHPDLIPEVRSLLQSWGGDYVIENVENAPLLRPQVLCGSMFGLHTRRHRLFETNVWMDWPVCSHSTQPYPTLGVYGDHPDKKITPRTNGKSRGVKASSIQEAQYALGIDWMTSWDDLTDAVPPAYTKWVGGKLLLPRVAKITNPWSLTFSP